MSSTSANSSKLLHKLKRFAGPTPNNWHSLLHPVLPLNFRLNSGKNQAQCCVGRDGDAELCFFALLYHKKSGC
ncbi:hypothetical protein QUB05_17795 [Microcoleus sp. F10-C6]